MQPTAWRIGLMIGLLATTQSSANDQGNRLRDDRDTLLAEEADRLNSLAGQLVEEGRAEAAQVVRSWIEPEPPTNGPRRFVPFPEIIPKAEKPADEIPEEARTIRVERAEAWFELAQEALKAGQYALADDCLRRVLARDGDHAEARRLLGFVPYQEGWATQYAVKLLESGLVRHDSFGWVPDSWVPKLESSQLPAPGRPGASWIPAEQADAMRQRDFESAWQAETPHFLIRANVPLAEVIEFGRRLEDFHEAFTAIMADVIGPERLPLALRYRRPGAVTPTRSTREKHQVYYFATKDQYVEHLRPWHGAQIAETLGLYLDPETARKRRQPPRSYFFNDPGGQLAVTETLYHEVSHQLLFELAGPSAFARNVGNFWVFEGLGTYFETIRPQPDGSLAIGGLVGVRIAEARRRIIEQGEYVPITDLIALDANRFNRFNGNPHLHYAQSMALTVFLMDHNQGQFREPFLEYVRDAYQGRLRPASRTTLAERVGKTYEELDRELKAFLKDD